MFTASARIDIHLSGITSLKDKRRIVKSLIERLKSRFNVAVAEVARHDNKRTAVIGLALVANDKAFAQQQLTGVLNFVYGDPRFYVGRVQRQLSPFEGD